MTELDETIRDHAAAPAQVSADNLSVSEHPLKDQIAADRYLAEKTSRAAHPRRAFTRVQILPPGAA